MTKPAQRKWDGWPEDGIVRLGPDPTAGKVLPGVVEIDAEQADIGPFRGWFIDVQKESVSCVRRLTWPT